MMTGRELIVYILENNLENDEIFKDGKLLGGMAVEEAAVNLHVGTAAVKAWVKLGYLDGITIDSVLYILPNYKFKTLSNNVLGVKND